MERDLVSFLTFITIVISVYSLLNYYVIRKHRNVLTLGVLPSLLLRLLVLTLVLAPFAAILSFQADLPVLRTVFSLTGFSWLAFLFLFLVIHGAADIVLYLSERFGIKPHPKTAQIILIFTLLTSVSLLIYGRFEADNLQIENVTIQSEKLPAHLSGLKIAQISDVHFSAITGVKKAQQLKEKINAIKPDLLVSTGDFVDRGIHHPEQIQAVLREIDAPLGKYAIIGNHEFYYGLDISIEFHQQAGFSLLNDKTTVIAEGITVVGVIDRTYRQFNMQRQTDEVTLLKSVNPNLFTLLLKHQPSVNLEATPHFDLQLSGHTHAGQIFPFAALVKMVFPYLKGMYPLDNGAQIYVNRGTGTWGPPFRLFAPPEITVFTLQCKT